MKQIVKDEIIQALRTRSGILAAEHVHLQRRLAEGAGTMPRTERHSLRQEYTRISDAITVNEWARVDVTFLAIDKELTGIFDLKPSHGDKVSIRDLNQGGGDVS